MQLHYTDIGTGKAIVFIHGMASSLRYWDDYISVLSKTHRVIALDLLGFGHSPKPKGEYDTDNHVDAINQTLEQLKLTEPFILTGHSMGALIALRLAATRPESVSKLVLIGMPVYKSPEEARTSITRSKRILKLAYYGRSSQFLCNLWCGLLRPISSRVATYYLKSLPKAVARESVLHTWCSYSQSMKGVIEAQRVRQDLTKLTMPIILLYGDRETDTVIQNVRELTELPKNIKVRTLAGAHHLPLEQPDEVMQIITGTQAGKLQS